MSKKTNISKSGEISHSNFLENIQCASDGSKTTLEILLNIGQKYPTRNFLGTIINNELVWQSYQEIINKIEKLSTFFNTLVKENEIIGIFSINRYEWVVSEYASYMSNCLNCPLYSTFGPDAVNLIMIETEMSLCCTSADKAAAILDILKNSKKIFIKNLIIFDDHFDRENEFLDLGIVVHYFNEIIQMEEIDLRTNKLGINDLATICYTSGTSGTPKGVQITHKNFISNICAFFRGQTKNEMYQVTKDEVYLSYLPLAHIMERLVTFVITSVGGSIGFFRGNPKEIKKDYTIIRPTFIIAVPRVLNLFKQKIEEGVETRGFFAKFIFNCAVKFKMWYQRNGTIKCWLLDTLIFNKIADEFGGRIRACLCGSASLSLDVLYFLQATMSIRIFQGYGQTETTGATTLCPLDFNEFDNVGIPYPSCKIKLSPVDGYDKHSGELLIKGDNVTSGYFKRPELNDDLFTEDNWLKTGDIGRYYNGVFKIEGRTKDRFKTGHGEYIEPEKIEMLLVGNIIQDIIITTIKGHDKIVAIVVCTIEKIKEEEILDYLIKKGNKLVHDKKMNRYEIPSAVVLLRKGFETFNGGNLLSPTAKKIRVKIEKYFEAEIKKCLKK
ncbi:long chain acyl-coa synthetase [Vairimorpha necatrix]|uniref:Long chain acyl-coa synthetase n=1 Tax=Vairimorpha necatrix TaxID=6039 RepID=A0AAX4JEC6_9MICR